MPTGYRRRVGSITAIALDSLNAGVIEPWLRSLHHHHAAHDDPVAGEGAEVGVLSRFFRRDEPQGLAGVGFEEFGRHDHFV